MTEKVVALAPKKRGLIAKPISAYQIEAIKWLQQNRIPWAELVAAVGPGGVGKSTLFLGIAARLTAGQTLPHDTLVHPPMNVGWCSAEDAPGRVLRPRFQAAGGDPERLYFIEGDRERDGTIAPVGLPGDSTKLRATIEELGLGLLVIDPLVAFTNGIDHHRADQLRQVTKRLSRIAQETHCTIIVIAHTNKSVGRSGMDRISGSVDLGNTARQVLLVGRPDGDHGPCAIVAGKENLCRRAPAIRYEIESVEIEDDKGVTFSVGRVRWGDEGEVSPSAIFGTPEDDHEAEGDRLSALEEAEAFLHAELADGELESAKLSTAARREGIAPKTLKRAIKGLGIIATRRDGVWWKRLPE